MSLLTPELFPWSIEAETHRLRLEVIHHKTQAHYFQAMHAQSLVREEKLKMQVAELGAKLRYERHSRAERRPGTWSGRLFSEADLACLRALIASHPTASRAARSRQACTALSMPKNTPDMAVVQQIV